VLLDQIEQNHRRARWTFDTTLELRNIPCRHIQPAGEDSLTEIGPFAHGPDVFSRWDGDLYRALGFGDMSRRDAAMRFFIHDTQPEHAIGVFRQRFRQSAIAITRFSHR
jgi:hypothetical protein